MIELICIARRCLGVSRDDVASSRFPRVNQYIQNCIIDVMPDDEQ